jgi:hypothetical protein
VKLDLTRAEYLTLLTAMQLADWVLHAHQVEEPDETQPFRELEQKVFSLAGEFGCEHLVEYAEEDGRFYASAEFDETGPAMELIEQFENESFWNELLERLVERDLLRQLGEKTVEGLDPEEREIREEPYRRLYGDEFAMHGVDRLEILDQRYVGDAKNKRKLS